MACDKSRTMEASPVAGIKMAYDESHAMEASPVAGIGMTWEESRALEYSPGIIVDASHTGGADFPRWIMSPPPNTACDGMAEVELMWTVAIGDSTVEGNGINLEKIHAL